MNPGSLAGGLSALATALVFTLGAPLAAQTAAPHGTVSVHFEGLRSEKGMLRACLTSDARYFLKCEDDPAARSGSVAAGKNAVLTFADVPPGDYTLAVLHDENGNSKVDTFLKIPKEGVGFSRNPNFSFGPPKREAALFHVPAGPSELTVKLKYFL